MSKSLSIVTLSLLLALLLSCAEPQPEAPQQAGVENIDLGISLSTVPAGIEVIANQGTSLELQPTNPAYPGTIWFDVGPEVHAVNLVEAVKEHQQRIEGRPEGEYLGAQELHGDFGVAFYSRGRFSYRGSLVEEAVALRIHPHGDRLLSIHYRYPAREDSSTRVEQLIEVLGEVE